MDGPKIRRLYYSSIEVSEIAEIRPYVLKTWEKKFPSLKPSKSKSGRRLFTPEELELVLMIKKLKQEGCDDEGIRHWLEGSDQEEYEEKKVLNNADKNQMEVLISEIKSGLNEILEILDYSNKQDKQRSTSDLIFGVESQNFEEEPDFLVDD